MHRHLDSIYIHVDLYRFLDLLEDLGSCSLQVPMHRHVYYYRRSRSRSRVFGGSLFDTEVERGGTPLESTFEMTVVVVR